MAQSSADIVIQNRRISQSETSAKTIRDVVNIIRSYVRSLSKCHFASILRYC